MSSKKPQGKSAAVPITPSRTRTAKPGTFDRISPPRNTKSQPVDPQGKQSLFSGADNPPSLGSAAVDCSKCHRRAVVSLTQLVQLSLPGVHAPVPGKGHRALMKCPTCGKRSWMSVTVGR